MDEVLKLRIQDVTHPQDLPENASLLKRVASIRRKFGSREATFAPMILCLGIHECRGCARKDGNRNRSSPSS